MSRVYLIRHGRAAADWSSHADPGLDDVGRAQAEAMAERLAANGRLPLIASPLRRTRETAAALERRWGMRARIEPRVGEIPSPVEDLAARAEWLRGIMPCRWPELAPSLRRWCDAVIEALGEIAEDTVVVSHYVAINAAVGSALNDDRVTCFRPDHCSCTVLDVVERRLVLVELGTEGATRVL
jgi:broad specificity phosphatase PhoE